MRMWNMLVLYWVTWRETGEEYMDRISLGRAEHSLNR